MFVVIIFIIKEKRPNATAKGLFLRFILTQLQEQTDRGSYGHCSSEDGEQPRLCDQGNRETRTSTD